jgi:glycosyltransferase involved in cell wall biosynthesis
MKILEAWARGVCVVATPEAGSGLEAEDGRELLVAPDAPGFMAALQRLTREPELRGGLIAAGRAALAARHDPGRIAGALVNVYERVLACGERASTRNA